MKHIILGNFGNHSIAVLQWAIEQQLSDLHFVSVNTGWAADGWQQRVQQGQVYAKQHHVNVIELPAKQDFSQLVEDRGQFPTAKFQWCAGLLKGVVVNEWLDSIDPNCQAKLLSGKHRSATRAYANLPHTDYDNPFYNGRTIWHPLFEHSQAKIEQLIVAAGFAVLPHRSLECQPCIHDCQQDVATMQQTDQQRLTALQQRVGQVMVFNQHRNNKNCLQAFANTCGSPWNCGE